jgi:hypothetical protein
MCTVHKTRTTLGLREQNCTQNPRTLSTTVPDDRGPIGIFCSRSATVILHCSTRFCVQYWQITFAYQTHHLSAWQFNRKEQQSTA